MTSVLFAFDMNCVESFVTQENTLRCALDTELDTEQYAQYYTDVRGFLRFTDKCNVNTIVKLVS